MNNVRNLLAGSLVYIACIVLLSLACNVSSGLPVADVIGQWLYFDKSALVVAGCLLMAGLMMEKRYFLFIPVSWVLVMLGGIEAVWGLRQLYGYAVSNHSLYVLTGSFFNPGPYSGYLAITLPVALGILLEQSKRNMPYYLSMGCIGTAIVVLPAGMSRSAWIAVVVSCAWV